MRIWTMDWWDNRKKEIKRIVEEVRRLQELSVQGKGETPCEIPQENTSVSDTEAVDLPPEDDVRIYGEENASEQETVSEGLSEKAVIAECIKPYTMLEISNAPLSAEEFLSGAHSYNILKTLEAILEAEAPIYRTALFKRVLNSFGITRSGARLVEYLNGLTENLNPIKTTDGEEVVYWNNSQDPNAYYLIRVSENAKTRRDAAIIPHIEMINAMCYVLYTQVGIPKDGLLREAAKVLGFPHVIGNVAVLVNNAFGTLQDLGLVTIESELCSLSEKGEEYIKHFNI